MIKQSFIAVGFLFSITVFAQDDLINKVIKNASLNSKFEFEEI